MPEPLKKKSYVYVYTQCRPGECLRTRPRDARTPKAALFSADPRGENLFADLAGRNYPPLRDALAVAAPDGLAAAAPDAVP